MAREKYTRHVIPEVAAPDSSWLLSDHHDTEVEDEVAADPWNINIADKEKSNGTTDDTSDASNHTQTADTTSGNLQFGTILPGLGGQINLFSSDDIGLQMGLFPDAEKWPPDDPIDATDQDWLHGEFLDETVDTVNDGFEGFVLDESPDEKFEDDFDIVEFDEGAQQPPWEIEPEEEAQELRRAREKAATIALLLDFRNTRERDNAISYLEELFGQMTHSATFRAIERVAEGIDLDTLKAMVEVRRIWMRRTDWWWGILYEPGIFRRGNLAFTWATTRLVCLARRDHPPESMIDEEWFDEWLRLPYGAPNYSSFASYIEEKILSHDAELLNEGLRHYERGDGYVETGDGFDWYRRIPDPEAVKSIRQLPHH